MKGTLTLLRWQMAGLALLAIYFTFIGGTFVTDLSFWPRVFHHVIVSAILFVWLISVIKRGDGFPYTPLDLGIAVLFATYAIATIFAPDPRVSVEALWTIAFHCLLFYLLVDLMRLWSAQTILEPIFLASGVVVIVGIFEYLSWYFGVAWLPSFKIGWFGIGGFTNPVPPISYRLMFTLGVATFLSAYLALLVPVGIAWALATRKRDVRLGIWLWVTGVGLVEILSFSRGGLLALGVSLPLFALLLFLGQDKPVAVLKRLWADWRVKAAVIGVVILVVSLAALWSRRYVEGSHAASDAVREDLWHAAWLIGASHPITGVGPYGFGRAMRAFRNPIITGDHLTSAHDIPLQLWAETGLLGVSGLMLLAFLVARIMLKAWQTTVGTEKTRVAGIVAALMGFAAQNLVDTITNTPVALLWLALLAYLVLPQVRQQHGVTATRLKKTVPWLVMAMLAVSMIGWSISDTAQYFFEQSLKSSAQGFLQDALRNIEIARKIDPHMGYYAGQEAQFLGTISATDSANLPQARKVYEQALAYEGSYSLLLANQAMVLAAQSDYNASEDAIEAAITYQPDNPRYWLWKARIHELSGDGLTATYIEVLTMSPAWAVSDFWNISAKRKAALDQFLADHNADGFSLEELSELPSGCMQLEPSGSILSNSLYCMAAVKFRINGDPSGAKSLIDQAIGENSADPGLYVERAWIRLAQGDSASAERDARTAIFIGDTRGYAVLGAIAEQSGDDDDAISNYLKGGPMQINLQGWDVAVYLRRGDLKPLPFLDAPGPGRYDLTAWSKLYRLYARLGRTAEAGHVRDAMLRADPYFDTSELDTQP